MAASDPVSPELLALRDKIKTAFPAYRLQIIDSVLAEPFLQLHKSALVGLILRVESQEVLVRGVVPSRMLSQVLGIYSLGIKGRKLLIADMAQWLEDQSYIVRIKL